MVGMLLPPSPWYAQEERGRLLREALERRDLEGLLEGYRVYLSYGLRFSETTIRSWEALMRHFLAYTWGLGRKGVDWEVGDLRRYLEDLRAKGTAPTTRRNYVSAFKQFNNFLAWCGFTPRPVEIPHPEVIYRKTRPLSDPEFKALLKALEAYESAWQPVLLPLVAVIGETGMHLRWALSMTPQDLDLAGPKVRLPGGWTDLPRPVRPLLQDYLAWRERVRKPWAKDLWLAPRKGTPPHLTLVSSAFSNLGRTDLGLPFRVSFTLVRVTGEARLVSRVGLKEAKRLLKRMHLAY